MSAPHLGALDGATRALIRLSATIAVGDDDQVRAAFDDVADVPDAWIEELLLQSYLFCGFPRALNATHAWRAHGRSIAPEGESAAETTEIWRARGEATCAIIYGTAYDKLRDNVRALHPVLDDAMVVEGYGRILSRPQLDLARRELCIVAACAVTGQHRQLHSHLRGAVNAGVATSSLAQAVQEILPFTPERARLSVVDLLRRVIG